MKRVLIISLYAICSPMVWAVSLAELIRMNRMTESGWDWLMSDSLYHNPELKNFEINQNSDTIFIDLTETNEGDYTMAGKAWNRVNRVYFNIKSKVGQVEKFSKNKWSGDTLDWYKNLLYKWDIDSLRKLEGRYSPIRRHYVVRMIINDDKITVDKASFYQPDTPYELLSERDKMARDNYNKRVEEYEKEKQRIREKLQLAKDVQSKSIWQRIADWFVSLWHSIFG